ncbi:Nucleoside-diphosphate-sugar epimerase [Yoonia tamlensis]|uniref:Nucleoside-diphosphate-sugar epimerase n=1 Tax=Yoonia tamlensis TaxID=390270 RepID=A0A1I6G9L7_9RHOB|nr:SDR family oxidoreductase [Yoonia tamlensis]SFR38878.1 Nucleoside-diphosphate-sugar epimerase [Yoonia tamlensis]
MRVLVTGSRGYIGSHLVQKLVAQGATVTGLDCDLYHGASFVCDPYDVPTIAKDIRDVVPADLEGQDTVIHLAGLSNDPLGDLDPALTHDINFVATSRLAQAAKAAGVGRFVFSSSCSSYGIGGEDLLTENSPLRPVTPYAVSKIRSEEALDRLASDSFCTVSMRSGTAYGLSARIRFDLVVNNLTAWAKATGQVRLKSDGSAWRPLVHAEDMAQAFVDAAFAPRVAVHRQAFNVGKTEDSIQIKHLAEMVKAAITGTEITFADEVSPDIRTYRVDCTKIKSIGFAPKWTVPAGIAALRDALDANPVPVTEFEGPRYQRLAHIKGLIASGAVDKTLRWQKRAVA